MEVNVVEVSSDNARKKGRNPDNWKRNVMKKERYSPSELPHRPTCHRNAISNKNQICKRFLIKRSKRHGNASIKWEPHYKSDINTFQNVCKKNKKISDNNPIKINTGLVKLKPAKLADVNKLLQKHFGDDWKTLADLEYYENVLSTESLEEELEVECDDEPTCEPHEEPSLLLV